MKGFDQWPTVAEAAEPKKTKRSFSGLDYFSEIDAVQCCDRLAQKHLQRNRSHNYPAFKEALSKVLSYCAEFGLDPKVYLEAQYAVLGRFCRARRMPIYPNMLFGAKARDRYNVFVRQRRQEIHTTHEEVIQKGDPWLAAEVLFGEAYVFSHLYGERGLTIRECTRIIREEFPELRWRFQSVKRKKVRVRALAFVLDRLDPGLSRRVLIKRKDWCWDDVAGVVRILQ